MRKLKMGHRLAVAGATGVVAVIATLGVGVTAATAAPADPPPGAAPQFNNGVVNAIPELEIGHDLLHDAEDR